MVRALPRRLLSFIAWAEVEHANVTLSDAGCFNPYAQPSIMSHGGLLAQLRPQKNISGCVPKARAGFPVAMSGVRGSHL